MRGGDCGGCLAGEEGEAAAPGEARACLLAGEAGEGGSAGSGEATEAEGWRWAALAMAASLAWCRIFSEKKQFCFFCLPTLWPPSSAPLKSTTRWVTRVPCPLRPRQVTAPP